MNIRYIAQPDEQIGRLILANIESRPLPSKIVFVSAFWGIQSVLRLRDPINMIARSGGDVRLVVGVDMGGTSREVLQEISGWPVRINIYKNRRPRVTFHPKIFLIENSTRGMLVVGSNNMTEGGLFTNYEACTLSSFDFPGDRVEYDLAINQLSRFLNPNAEVARQLDNEYLEQLLSQGGIPSESQASERRQETAAATRGSCNSLIYGTEQMPPIPPLPSHLLEALTAAVNRHRRQVRSGQAPAAGNNASQLTPGAFYMTLPTLQGPNIPGESRIPLGAIELAQDFWGWPEMYERSESPRSGSDRVYHNWRPKWRILSADDSSVDTVQEVRMYMYENSSDFRFHARPLINAGADLGDIVKIERVALNEYEYECTLARQGGVVYEEWLRNCTYLVRNSSRRFGYA